jgi:hypothetical protein
MTAEMTIADGAPAIWDSQAIIPSLQNLFWPTSQPPTATLCDDATGVFVYVQVTNTGDPSPACPVGQWAPPVDLTGLQPNGDQLNIPIGTTYHLDLIASGDQLVSATGASVTLGTSPCQRRAWGVSPDGHFLAYVFGPTANNHDWTLRVVALDGATDANDQPIAPRTIVLTYGGAPPFETYQSVWDNHSFGWIGSDGVFAHGTNAAGTLLLRAIARFRISGGPTLSSSVAVGGTAWVYLASPCGSQIAYLHPAAATTRQIQFYGTRTISADYASVGGVPTGVSTNDASPTITTVSHTANGVSVNPGTGGPISIDDPDLTATPGGLRVVADRLPLGTSLTGLTRQPIGIAAGPPLAPGVSAWIQMPQASWDNFGEEHWCLVAQAFQPNLGIARTWFGSGAFPIFDANSAQRNITIHSRGTISACP